MTDPHDINKTICMKLHECKFLCVRHWISSNAVLKEKSGITGNA